MRKYLCFLLLIFILSIAAAQVKTITTISEDFEGRLYLFDDRDEAMKGLKANLSEKMERQLKKIGFSDDYIFSLLKKAVFNKMSVIEKRVEILKDNKKTKTTAFDISGQISVTIDENDVRELAQNLKKFSPVSDEERVFYRDALRNFLQLSSGIKDLDIENLKLKLAEIYKADIMKLTRTTFETDNTSFSFLKERVVDILNYIDSNRKYLGDEADIREVTENLISNVDSYYKRSLIDVSNYEIAISAAESIAKMMPYNKEQTLTNLMFIIEFKWAENIQNISQNQNVELDRLLSEAEKFSQRFKSSKFMKNMRAKAEKRLIEDLKDTGIGYEKLQYIAYITNLLGLKDKELIYQLVLRCESVLENVESASDEQSEKVLTTFDICMKNSGTEKKKRLSAFRDKFIRTEKTRIYKNSLGNIAFVMRLVRYIYDIPFGVIQDKIGSEKFADFLNEGSATSGCSCTLDPTDECRIYSYAGEQFEFVSRYRDAKLYEVAICNMNLGGKGAVLVSYLKENFKPMTNIDVQSFEDKDRTYEFEVKKGVVLSIEKIGPVANLSVYDKTLRHKRENKITFSEKEGDPITVKIGDCVEWDCEIECRYRGKVDKITGMDLKVVITSAPKAAELNIRKTLKKSDVKRCSAH